MAYINSIEIPPQESAEALAAAMADALAGGLGWTQSGNDVIKTETGLRFAFLAPAGIKLAVGNAAAYIDSNNSIVFSAASTYYVDYIRTDSAVAAGIRVAGGTIVLANIIAENTAGEHKAIGVMSLNGNTTVLYYLAEDYTNSKTMFLPLNTSADCATSIVKMPDIFGGCMFRDLYIELSCPYRAKDKVYYIGGKYYRHVGLEQGGLALPVG